MIRGIEDWSERGNIYSNKSTKKGYWVSVRFDDFYTHYLQIAVIGNNYVITDIDNIDYYVIEDCGSLYDAIAKFMDEWYRGYDDGNEYHTLYIIENNDMNLYRL